MQITLTKKEVDIIEEYLRLNFDISGITFSGISLTWNRIEEIRILATRENIPVNYSICPKLIDSINP